MRLLANRRNQRGNALMVLGEKSGSAVRHTVCLMTWRIRVKSAGENSWSGLAEEGLESQANAELNNNTPATAMTSLRFMTCRLGNDSAQRTGETGPQHEIETKSPGSLQSDGSPFGSWPAQKLQFIRNEISEPHSHSFSVNHLDGDGRPRIIRVMLIANGSFIANPWSPSEGLRSGKVPCRGVQPDHANYVILSQWCAHAGERCQSPTGTGEPGAAKPGSSSVHRLVGRRIHSS